jgi:hypothetical protein
MEAMSEPIHIAVTQRVKKSHIAEFERALASLRAGPWPSLEPGGCTCLGSESMEYGIMRSFASTADRDAFYQTPLYREWLTRIEPMVEGEATYRELEGLEAWFRSPHAPMPPTWENGPAYMDRGMASQHARSSDSDASARSKFSAGSHGRTHCCRDRRHPHLGRHAFAGQSRAPLASRMNEGAK